MTQEKEHVGPHISIKAEPVFHIGNFKVTNSLLLSGVVFVFFFAIAATYFTQSRREKKGMFFYFITFILKSLYDFFESVFHEKIWVFYSLVTSFFLFILLQNWFGLLPGVGSLLIKVSEGARIEQVPLFRANTADLNTTFSLAIISFILIQVYGFRYLGFGGYIGKFVNLKSPIGFFTGVLETISEFSKILSFAFRLFGNIFAGEVLLAVIAFLIPVLVPFPFLLLEVFVGFIQALVFAMLTSAFIALAISPSH